MKEKIGFLEREPSSIQDDNFIKEGLKISRHDYHSRFLAMLPFKSVTGIPYYHSVP